MILLTPVDHDYDGDLSCHVVVGFTNGKDVLSIGKAVLGSDAKNTIPIA